MAMHQTVRLGPVAACEPAGDVRTRDVVEALDDRLMPLGLESKPPGSPDAFVTNTYTIGEDVGRDTDYLSRPVTPEIIECWCRTFEAKHAEDLAILRTLYKRVRVEVCFTVEWK